MPPFPPSHTHQSFLLSSPSPPGSLLCPAVSWSHQLSHSSHTAHHCGSQPILPPAPLTASASQSSACIHHPNFFLPLLMNTYSSVYTSSRNTSVPALCSQIWDLISPVPGRSRSCHYRDDPTPAAQPWAGATQECSAGKSLGAARAQAQPGSPGGCSAPEAGVCWWMGIKVFRKLNNLKQGWVCQEHALMSPSLVTTDSVPERDGSTALNQKAGGFVFFPLSNVGKTAFLFSSPLVFLGNGWIGLADNIKINLAWERDTTWKSQIKW